MSKSVATIIHHRARLAVFMALAVMALVIGFMNVSAVHNEALLELDGNTAFNGGSGFNPGAPPGDNITTAATFDWESVCERGPSGDIQLDPAQTSADTATCAKDYGNPNTSYHTGSDKDFQNISDPADPTATDVWGCVTAANPLNKNDILNAYAALSEDASGDTILYFGQERDTNNGDAFVGFWFLQDDVGVPSPCGTDPFTGVHEEGDVLILANYTNGGSIGSIGAFLWTDPDGDITTPGICPSGPLAEDTLCTLFTPGAADCRDAAPIDLLCGRINSGPAPVAGRFATPWEPRDAASCSATGKPAGCLDTNTFFEGGINLTDVLALAGRQVECLGTFVSETRSSAATDATLKDFALGDFDTCGKITIKKVTDPAQDAQDFSYATTGASPVAPFVLDTDPASATTLDTQVFPSVSPGNYSVTETPIPGNWDLTNLSCTVDKGTASFNISGATANISIGTLGEVTCTYTNVKRGQITIIKNTIPDGPTNFGYTSTTSTSTAIGSFSLDDDGLGGGDAACTGGNCLSQQTFSNLKPGSYTVTEGDPTPAFDLTGLTCSAGGSTDLATRTATVTLPAGGSVTCTYTNTQRAQLTIIKDANPDSVQNFSYSSTTPTSTAIGSFQLDDDGLGGGDAACTGGNCLSQRTFSNLKPSGTAYTVTETIPTGWTLTNLVCNVTANPTGTTSASANLATATGSAILGPGGHVTCTYTNVSLFKLVIYTCDTTTEKLIISTVNPGGKSTVAAGTLPALSGKTPAEVEAYLCEVLGATGAFYDNLASGTHTRDTIIP